MEHFIVRSIFCNYGTPWLDKDTENIIFILQNASSFFKLKKMFCSNHVLYHDIYINNLLAPCLLPCDFFPFSTFFLNVNISLSNSDLWNIDFLTDIKTPLNDLKDVVIRFNSELIKKHKDVALGNSKRILEL